MDGNEKERREIHELAERLRALGCIVAIWTPDEIPDGADLGTLQDIVIERGNDYLASVG